MVEQVGERAQMQFCDAGVCDDQRMREPKLGKNIRQLRRHTPADADDTGRLDAADCHVNA